MVLARQRVRSDGMGLKEMEGKLSRDMEFPCPGMTWSFIIVLCNQQDPESIFSMLT
jgi:hypothetical protein